MSVVRPPRRKRLGLVLASAQLTVANGCPPGSAALGAIVANPPAPPGRYAYADPYQDDYGAFAMLIAGRACYGDVLSYIKWYLRQVSYSTQADTYQGVVGSIFDYTVDLRACSESSTGFYDSSDAYAGTFLSLVSAFVQL